MHDLEVSHRQARQCTVGMGNENYRLYDSCAIEVRSEAIAYQHQSFAGTDTAGAHKCPTCKTWRGACVCVCM